MTTTATRTTAETLRALADFIEEHGLTAETIHVYPNTLFIQPHWDSVEPTVEKKSMVAWARAIPGRIEKTFSEHEFALSPENGALLDFETVRITARRDAVCRKIETTIEVPERYVPAREAELIPARVETKVEWVCDDPLLAPAREAVAS